MAKEATVSTLGIGAPPGEEAAVADDDATAPGINLVNLLNLFGYLLSLATSYLGAIAGWFDGITQAELFSKYQTLVTPNLTYIGYAWGAIFAFEGLFAVAQLLPRFRSLSLVQKGVGPFFCLACTAQASWAVFFGFQFAIAAFVASSFLLIALLVVIKKQGTVVNEEIQRAATLLQLGEREEEAARAVDATAKPPGPAYWLLRFPFALHGGWIVALSPCLLSVVFVEQGMDATHELWAAVLALPLAFGCCMGLLLREDPGSPSYVVPAVVAYACAGHDEASINMMKNLSGFCAVCLVAVMISRVVALFLRDQWVKCHTPKNVEVDEDEEMDHDYVKA
ncbi:hypothetical protein ACHAWF_007237 [Thalassiosira exigua]